MRNRMHPAPPPATGTSLDAPWATLIPQDQWDIFQRGAHAIESGGVPCLLGGAMALATYTGRWRNTKDIDMIVRPADHERAIAALQVAGFEDYFSREPYDRSWIFRGYKDGVIYDIFWELPNHRVKIDDAWFARARSVRLRDHGYCAVPPEELVRVKLYVMQRERCDWVDVLNILGGTCDRLDWSWLVQRMGRDLALLHGALAVFNWLCPGRARSLPQWLREQFALAEPESADAEATEQRRVNLFDSRPWFAPLLPADRPLER